MSEKVTVGLADDEEIIHTSVRGVIERRLPQVAVLDFYDTSELKDFLYDEPLGLDLLLLDVHFEGGESGIEALPKIREYSPGLPVTLLTGERDPETLALAYPYRIEYLPKPVDENTFVIHMGATLARKSEEKEIVEIRRRLEDQTQYARLVEEEYQRLDEKLAEVSDRVVPPELATILKRIFVDVDFGPKALVDLVKAGLDERIIRVLRSIDWKEKPTPSMHVQPFKSRKNENIWEYRFSKTGRLFVQFVPGGKPLIDSVDFKHRHKG